MAFSELQVKKGHSDKALIALEKALKLSPDNVNIKARLASLKYEQGKFEEARSLTEEALKKNSIHPYCPVGRGETCP